MKFTKAFTVLSVAVMLVCCAHATAQTSTRTAPARRPAQPAVANEPAAGVISGSVVNESGEPLAGVTVSVWETNRRGAQRTTATDAEGSFRVRGLMPSLYSVSAFLPAYVMQGNEFYSPAGYHRIGDTVRLTLTPGGVITGKVTNAEGEPVIGVRVRGMMVRNASGEGPRIRSYAASDVVTDDRGVYRMFGLPAGAYVVSAGGAVLLEPFKLYPYVDDVPTYAPSSTRDTASEIVVRTGEESTADIRYRGEPGHVVSGTVKVPGAAAGGSVSLTPVGSMLPIGYAFQSPGGRGFALKGVADGEYEIVGQEIPQTSGSTTDVPTSEPRRLTVKGADVTGLELVPRPLPSLSGRIVLEPAKVTACENKRRPLFSEMLVLPQRPERDDQDRVPFLQMFSGPAQPDASGNFAIRNLMPGKYLLEPRFFGRYWYLDSISTPGTPKVDAAANWTNVKSGSPITNFTITLAEGAASIRGKVTTANAPEVSAGLAFYLLPAEREKFGDVLRYFVSSVEGNGAFALNNLPPGRYHVLVQPFDATTGTVFKLRLPEAAEARAKLRRATETYKTDVDLKPCQSLTDHNVTFQP
jgi:hypothetical protein